LVCSRQIVNTSGEILDGECEGNLVITDACRALMRTVYGDHQRFVDTISNLSGMYFTGDGARRTQGYYWITGRVDDVINVSGIARYRRGRRAPCRASKSAEALWSVIHTIQRAGHFAYVTLKTGGARRRVAQGTDRALRKHIADRHSGPLHWAPAAETDARARYAPHSAKNAENQQDQLGDISTLADRR